MPLKTDYNQRRGGPKPSTECGLCGAKFAGKFSKGEQCQDSCFTVRYILDDDGKICDWRPPAAVRITPGENFGGPNVR